MGNAETSDVDRLAEATDGRLHWNDPGMDDFEKGWEDFPLGTRVEVRTVDKALNTIWRKGTVVETHRENDRGIHVECDDKWHDNMPFYKGHGAVVMVYMNTRRGILSNIRTIDEPRREITIPRAKPMQLAGKGAELLRFSEIAVEHSGGHLRIAFNEEDTSEEYVGSAHRFLKLDGKRLGRDIELYRFMGDDIQGWELTLVMVLEEILLPIKKALPEAYDKAGEALRTLGESVYGEDKIDAWRKLF